MKQIIMIESDLKHLQAFKSVHAELGHDSQVIHFKSVAAFQDALKAPEIAPVDALAEEVKTATLLKSEVGLLVVDLEIAQSVSLEYWRDLLPTFGAPASSDDKAKEAVPTRLILTGYENENKKVDFGQYVRPYVFTFLIKPFDRLLLKQYLQLAAAPFGKIESGELYSQEIETQIELIKDIQMESITELGFRTFNNKAIPVGKIARYFGSTFGGSGVQSLFASCTKCTPVAGKESEFECSFTYFGIPKERLSELRVMISKSPKKEAVLAPPVEKAKLAAPTALVLSRDQNIIKSFGAVIEERSGAVKIETISRLADLINQLPPANQKEFTKVTVKTLVGTLNEVRLSLDPAGTKILACAERAATGFQPLNAMFGEKIEALKSRENGLFQYLPGEDQKALQALLTAGKLAGELILKVNLSEDNSAFVKILSLEKANEDPLGQVLHLTFKELSATEAYEATKGKSQKLTNIHFVLVDAAFAKPESMGAIKEIVRILNGDQKIPAKFISVSNVSVTLYSQLKTIEPFDDVFAFPFDMFYVIRKLKMFDSNLFLKDVQDSYYMGLPLVAPFKTGLPATMTAVSEVHVSIRYARAIEIGRSRRFVLQIPNDRQMPEILAVCQNSQESDEGGFRCDFLFFGVGELELKFLRQWIKENYVQAKLKDAKE